MVSHSIVIVIFVRSYYLGLNIPDCPAAKAADVLQGGHVAFI